MPSLITKQMADEAGVKLSTAHSRLCRGKTVEEALKPIKRADTYHGRICKHCGHTEKYRSNSKCIMHDNHDVLTHT